MKVKLVFNSEMWYVIKVSNSDVVKTFTEYIAAEYYCTKRKYNIVSTEGLDDED